MCRAPELISRGEPRRQTRPPPLIGGGGLAVYPAERRRYPVPGKAKPGAADSPALQLGQHRRGVGEDFYRLGKVQSEQAHGRFGVDSDGAVQGADLNLVRNGVGQAVKTLQRLHRRDFLLHNRGVSSCRQFISEHTSSV